MLPLNATSSISQALATLNLSPACSMLPIDVNRWAGLNNTREYETWIRHLHENMISSLFLTDLEIKFTSTMTPMTYTLERTFILWTFICERDCFDWLFRKLQCVILLTYGDNVDLGAKHSVYGNSYLSFYWFWLQHSHSKVHVHLGSVTRESKRLYERHNWQANVNFLQREVCSSV